MASTESRPLREWTPLEFRAAVFGPAVIALFFGTAVLAAVVSERSSRRLVSHTRDVRETLDRTFTRLLDAETGERGYTITGDTAYLEPFVDAQGDVQSGLRRLRALTVDQTAQQRRLDTLELVSSARLALLDSGVLVRRSAGIAGVADLIRSGRGKALMDRARSITAAMHDHEARLLAVRRADEDNRARFTLVLVAAGSLAAALLALVLNRRLTGYASTRTIMARELDQKNAELSDQAVELEQQVEEIRMINQELEETTERLSALASMLEEAESSTHLGSWDWDIATNTVMWSNEMFRVYGLEPNSAAPTYEGFLARVHPDDRAVVDAAVRASFETHAPFSFDHRITRPDGTERTLHAEGRVIVGPEGKPVRMVGSGHDITELARARAERERLVAELATANRAKMEFLTAMSHELRTPLNAIDGYAELLTMGIRGPVTVDQAKDLERIRQSGRHLLSLINDILNFAKVQAGQVELRVTTVRLCDALSAVEALVAPQISAKGLRFQQVPVDDSALAVRADQDRLQQVMLNLVTNAIKFTDPGGTITLSCEADGDMAHVRIRDTGRGIPAEKFTVIFDPFVQVDRTGNSAGTHHGLGLGLAISRDLVRQMGGALTVDSVVGVGSTFSVTVPRAEDTLSAAAL